MNPSSVWQSTLEKMATLAAPTVHDSGAPQAYWLIEGAVDLFLSRDISQVEPDDTGQALHPVCRITEGNLFVVAEPPSELSRYRLRFTPLPGSQLIPLDQHLLEDIAAAGELESACIRWIGTLLRAANRGMAPRGYRPIETNQSITLGNDEVVAIASGMAWFKVASGCILLLGEEKQALDADTLFCLHADAWLAARGTSHLEPYSFGECLQQQSLLPMLLAQQAVLLHSIINRLEEAELAASERMALRRRSAMQQMESALHHLAGLLRPGQYTGPASDTSDSVLAACRAVGRELNIDFPALPRAAAGLSSEDRLALAAQTARVQKRRVALRGRWWEEDAGPLVAMTQENDICLALLPNRDGRKTKYTALDPASGERTPVDQPFATRLAPFAYSFFPPLPARRLAFADLFRLGLAGRGKELSMAMLIASVLGLMGMLSPIAIGFLFDHVIPETDRVQLLALTAGLLGAALATLFFSLLHSEVLLRLEGRMEATIQAAVWDRVLKLPVGFFRNYSAGDLAQRVNTVNTIHQQLSGAALSGLLTGLFSFLNLALLFCYFPLLAMLGVGLIFLAVVVNTITALLLLSNNRRLIALQGKLSGQVLEYLSGIAKLRVAAAEARAFARWAVRYAEAKALNIRSRGIQNFSDIFLSAFSVLASVALFYAVGMPLSNSTGAGTTISTGAFVAFTSAFAGFFANFMVFSRTLLNMLQIVPLLERARPILETLPESDPMRAHPGELRGDITVSNVVFRYQPDGLAVLDGVSFTARPGEFIAVVGPSGSGKSTLLRLLLGFEQAESGSIYFDGKDLTDIDLQSLRSQLGVVLQSGQLMTGDIYTNIVGAHNLTVDHAWEAARLCGLDTDIEAMPMGMHTVLGEGANTLSGGQRQRILIARAIVRRPRILFFDEATSALDNRTQALVSRSVEQLKATRIVIAHRLSTILNADRILVMDRGHVAQSGTYAELMAQPGLFRELAERQLA